MNPRPIFTLHTVPIGATSIDPGRADAMSGGLRAAPLFHAAWLFAAGIAAAHAEWLRPSWLLIALLPVAVLCAVAAMRAQRIAWLPIAALWLMVGAWCAEMQPGPAPAPDVVASTDGLLRTVEGTVEDAGVISPEAAAADGEADEGPAQRIDVRVATLEHVTDDVDEQRPAAGAIRLTVRWPAGTTPQPLACGEQLRAALRLALPEVYGDAGVWSRKDYLLDQGITGTASVHADRVERLGAQPATLPCRIHALQRTMSARLLALPARMTALPAALRLSEEDAIMLDAMTTGDRTFLTHALRVGFERTGSFHMLVVSGFHLAVVAGSVLWIARRLRLPRLPATLVTLAATFSYALFTGFAAPVQRSLWMITLYLLGRLIYRERNALNTIGFAALCLLAASPRSLFDSGLQMTLLAVVSIAGVAAPLLERTVQPYIAATRELRLVAIDIKLEPRQAQFRVMLRMLARDMARAGTPFAGWHALPWLVRWVLRVAELVVVSCVVEMAMALPMAMYFHRITLFSLPVNMVVLPLLGVLIPAALVMLLGLLAAPAVAVAAGAAAGLVLHFSVWLVHVFGGFALGDLRVPAPAPWQIAGFCALTAGAILLALRGGARARVPAFVALVLAAVLTVLPRPVDHPHNALLFEALDVGQGDSLLLIAPDGKTMLVDGGGSPIPQPFDIGEDVVSATLWARGIRHLDVVALTHAHVDHLGGLPTVLRNFRPDELWVGNNPNAAPYEALLREAHDLHVRVRTLRAGDALTLGTSSVRVLAPMRDYVPREEPTNDDSLVMRVAYGATSALLEGDAEAPVEQAMLAEPDLNSTVLKVGHHGSLTSTTPDFLARVAPRWAVISCGLRNRYEHPREEVLQELETSNVRTYATDIAGAVCFRLNGTRVDADPMCRVHF